MCIFLRLIGRSKHESAKMSFSSAVLLLRNQLHYTSTSVSFSEVLY